ncbi:hypothetical protein PDO_3797 [Rhizobium sp. PDO1-076]|uniref:hypothetical protein n=1 Tax=Rhizobium sp. PDO1-076 TaxID=1125979 RepID=UPI00024E31D8|nr:hypothetical protein [Rhizobium sp. PDO1-076]EHS54080.1 hypothetical protein PDO_3797 [Rhizobium sp. PDO1-076]
MKTPQQNFVVEFKSGRRHNDARSGSIWGNTDLKALVRAAEADAPHLFDAKTAPKDGIPHDKVEAAPADRDESLVPPIELAVSDCEKTADQV